MSCSQGDEAGSERCDDTQQEQKASHEGASAASSSVDTLLSGGGTSAGSSHLLTQIEKLRAEKQQALRNVKKELAKNMKNAMRQKKRLQTRAMNLTDGDLVEVLRMRKAKKTAEGQSGGTAQD